jgi:leader peptidase (prepilin peptidase)/N-methyltransferase
MGDVKMMAMVGAFLGWPLAVLTIGVGSLMGSCIGIFFVLFRNMSLQTKLALGVYLGIGAALSLFYGLPILQWYAAMHR